MKSSYRLLFILLLLLPRVSLAQEKITWEKDGSEMVMIPGGTFEMGDSKNGPEDFMKPSQPVHTVTLDAFYMDKCEVTNTQYREFMEATGHRQPAYWNDPLINQPNQPVVGVGWVDAAAYANWVGKRLPTEAEWEYAARGGLAGKRYVWGDGNIDGKQCNFADKNAPNDFTWADRTVDDGYQYTALVGSYSANGYGLHDMAGNVWEWCADWYDENYYGNSPAKNPMGPDTGFNRVLRGGSWIHNIVPLRVAIRDHDAPNNASAYIGFRCVITGLPATINIRSSSTSLVADGSTTTSLTITLKDTTDQNLSGQVVTLTADNGTVSAVTDNGDGTYTATYTAGSQAGTATVTAKTANGKTDTIQITLTKVATFVMSVLEPELSVPVGESVSSLIELEGKDSFSGTIDLSATDLPKNTTAGFDSESVKLTVADPIQTAQLTLSLDQDIEAKTYEFTVSASSEGGQTEKVTFTLKVEARDP
ncbi:MAG: SUMF1/EgtB/PvdO family nonheme iron enzyme, partial [Candidatus Poribacteria bacterium]|nr:SUMF1/EgtB/PvdO family nonheme iron enzyme [Candidatus Poribacteria bacterium]